jgi:hypothetical protein
MKYAALLLAAFTLMAAPAFGQKVYIDYDKDYDSSNNKTFAWRAGEEATVAASNPLLHSRILNAIEHYITMNGSVEVQSDPDVWVTYHASSQEEVVFNTSTYGYGYPGSWHGGYGGYYGRGYYGGGYYGGANSISTISTYQRGTLIVDVWDAKSNELVWRGIAENITISDNPSKMVKRVDKALEKMVRSWQKIKTKAAKERAKP